MGVNYGFCTNHSTRIAVNAKRLCLECTKERHERIAESKGLVTKSARNSENLAIFKQKDKNGFSNTPERESFGILQKPIERDRESQLQIQVQKTATFKKAKINHRSEKGKELARQELLLFQKLFRERPPSCEYCGVEIIVFNPANYHHTRTKGSHPELRLVESNIVKICFDCHLKEHSFKPRNSGRN